MRKIILFATILLPFILNNYAFAQAPTATTEAATGVGIFGAILNGTVNANSALTTVRFEYGLDTGYGNTVTADQSPVTGSTNTPVSGTVSELAPSTTYHYRVVAVNANGTTNGADMTFTALSVPPAAVTDPATAVGSGGATLHGTVNPFGSSTTVTFEYGTDTSYGTMVTADQSPITIPVLLAIPNPVTVTITGLADNTVYHYRVAAVNAVGTTYGQDRIFTLGSAGTIPTATTNAASSITAATATLNGIVNAGDAETTVIFEYGSDTGYGTMVTADQNPVVGTTNTIVTAVVGELLPNTTYHVRVVADNTHGTVNGDDMTFITLPLPPIASTDAAAAIGTTAATLNGTVSANNSSTTVTFQYGIDTNYGTTVTANQSPVTGATNTAVSRSISGLMNGITYHYRVLAVNAGGTTYGSDMTFTTGTSAPTATTNAATAVGTTSATLNGTVNANNAPTGVTFELGTDNSYGRTVTADQTPVTGSSNTAVSVSVLSLLPATTYHFRMVAQNANGTAYGADMTFTTRSAPTVTTNVPSLVTTTGATLNGTVNAHNSSATVTFEYGLTTAYGTTVTADQSPVTGAANTPVNRAVSGLTGNTTYHYRVVGQNADGTTNGADMTFTTIVAAPTAVTNSATSVLFNGATLNGTINANNAATTVTFEYGTTIGYGTTVTADQSPVSGSAIKPVSVAVTGLANNTTYHYRVVAVNGNGTTNGADMTFTTSFAPTAVTQATTAVGGSSATLNAIVNGNGFGTTIYFDYGLTFTYGITAAANPSSVFDNIDTPVNQTITGLLPNTTYHFRVRAQGFTTTNGADMTFTTASIPTAVTNAATAVGSSTATLNGTVNAADESTTVFFEYGPDTNYGRVAFADQSPVTGLTNTAVSASINSLAPNASIHYRVVAQNAHDTVYGADMAFTTTPSAPTATTTSASGVTLTSAVLNGLVNAGNDSTTVTFEYGLDTSYGTTVTADQSPLSGFFNTPVSRTVIGLAVNTTYHYRVVGQNGTGTTYGEDASFSTSAFAPTVVTLDATNTNPTGATLNGTVNANGALTTVTFEYGPDTSYGRVATAVQSPVAGTANVAVNVTVTDLNYNNLYHYRIVGNNAVGTTYGADMVLRTVVRPIISGNITNGVNPLAGVRVRFSHNGHTEFTDGAGHYSYMVDYETTTTITASIVNYSFTPVSIMLNNVIFDAPDQNFTGSWSAEPTSKPVIDAFFSDQSAGSPPLVVNFAVEAHDPDGGKIVSYIWEGSGSSAFALMNHQPMLARDFDTVGHHRVTVTVIDDEGQRTTSDPISLYVFDPVGIILPMPFTFASVNVKAGPTYAVQSFMINNWNEPATVAIEAVGESGEAIGENSVVLPPYGKCMVSAGDFEGLGYDHVTVTSDQPLVLFSEVASGDSVKMASLLVSRPSSRLYINHIVSQTSLWDSMVWLSNQMPDSVAVSSFLDVAGESSALQPVASIVYDVGSALPDPVADGDAWGLFQVTTTDGEVNTNVLSGFEMFVRAGSDGAATELAEGPSNLLYIPHIPTNNEVFWTGFAFLNPGNTSVSSNVMLFNESGGLVGMWILDVPARTKVTGVASKLFPGSDGASWGTIDAGGSGLIGLEIFGTYAGGICGFSLNGSAYHEGVLPMVDAGQGEWTGIVLDNQQSTETDVTITLMGDDGAAKASNTVSIGARSQFRAVIDNLFADTAIENTDFVRFSAESAIIGVEVTGDLDRTWMKALGIIN